MENQKSLLSRAVRVIEAISRNRENLRFSEISRVLDNPSPSTVNKILKVLTEEGVLRKTSKGRYALGRKIYFWGRVMADQNRPIQTIREQMKYLHKKYRVSVNVFTCVDQTMFCLECYMDSGSPFLYPAGKSLPMQLSVQGAVFFIPPEKLHDPAFLEKEAEDHEEQLQVKDLEKMIRYAEKNDLQDDFALFYPGMHRFSVPLRENGQTVMTLGAGISVKRTLEGGLTQRIVSDLQQIRTRIETSFE